MHKRQSTQIEMISQRHSPKNSEFVRRFENYYTDSEHRPSHIQPLVHQSSKLRIPSIDKDLLKMK